MYVCKKLETETYRPIHVRKTFVAGTLSALRASDTLIGFFARYKFVTYLLTYLNGR